MYAVLLVWVWASTTCFQAFAGCWGRCMLFSFSGSGPILPAFRPSQDAGGDVCCSPFLGLGLYYLLSGLCRMLWEMYAVLLIWVYTTSFQTLLDVEGEMYAVLLVWVWASTTCFQAFAGCWGRCMLFSLSVSILPAFRPCWMSRGDVCCSPCLGLYYQLSDLAGC